ncbi:MAG TPA: alkaline phosphatase family protein [Candidatus Acidoferrales bacterium]|nr:alkaline phosphatase family protein [Candidatus Acidoferrales bacterium]
MFKKAAAMSLAVAMMAAPMFANEGDVPKGVPRLDHVFVIMMENHAYGQIVGNPSAPFTNKLMQSANAANNYFAVGHPSLTNYLEVVGGSNFGVETDNSPDWHNTNCVTNLASGTVATDNPASPNVCPIWGTGTDGATPVFDFTNETAPPSITEVTNVDGVKSFPAAKNISGKTIADQLDEHGMSWKSYQESLPAAGADGVNNSDGYFSNLLSITSVLPAETQTLINLYAVKHNPFAYFQNIQQGNDADSSLKNMVGFEGKRGLFEDLESGKVPNYSFIAPNQCNDQHGRGNAGPVCDFDPSTLGTQVGLNPALIYQGDLTLRNLVKAIHASPAWSEGHNAIVILWDENDYSATPNVNQVLLIVDTNYGAKGVQSSQFYTHFSLLKTIEGGFGLPCLNHACDAETKVMSDLFGHDDHDGKW